jgi:DtxR family Mn-dependent transcriptional regulator
VLAVRLAVAPSSVTEMVKKLAAQGLVTHQPYGAIRLTDAGLSRALGVVRRHRLVETWLVSDMGYGWDAVHDEAEVLEHAISDRLLEAIDAHLGRPARDPHGDPIPQADGSVVSIPTVLLSEARDGHTGEVVRISDRDPLLLRRLAAGGIRPGVSVTLSNGSLTAPGGTPVGLDAEGREAVWLTA